MILMKIEDFKAKPSIIEYLLLYLTSSAFLIVGTASILGSTDPMWAWLCVALFGITIAVLYACRSSRMVRAQAFYQEWLRSLKPQEVCQLIARLRTSSPEQALLKRGEFSNLTK